MLYLKATSCQLEKFTGQRLEIFHGKPCGQAGVVEDKICVPWYFPDHFVPTALRIREIKVLALDIAL